MKDRGGAGREEGMKYQVRLISLPQRMD